MTARHQRHIGRSLHAHGARALVAHTHLPQHFHLYSPVFFVKEKKNIHKYSTSLQHTHKEKCVLWQDEALVGRQCAAGRVEATDDY